MELMGRGGDYSSLRRRVSWTQRLHIDIPLLFLLLLLTVFGIAVLYSASGQEWPMVKRQIIYFIVAYMAMFFVAQFSLQWIRQYAWLFYVGTVALLIAVKFLGININGATRWLDFPGLPRFQPSELAKLALPLMIAAYLSKRTLPPGLKHVFWSLVIMAVPVLLILTQPDLGTSLVVAASGLLVLFLSGLSWWYITTAVVGALATMPLMWFYVLEEYQKGRIRTLFNPEADKWGAGWNIIQSTTAIGSGGLQGKGWLLGTQSQLDFLPESHTDFIVAVLSEEFGFIGFISLLMLYLLIVIRGVMISWQAQDMFGRLLAGSITLIFFVYIFVNIGMVGGLLPVVGLPLPFISYGGTALISLAAGFGLLMAVSTQQKRLIS